ncbi:helix-turn-helix transcriptional regulator [Gaetbulibacter saemankumensis]|uniref:helix-turn-helix transcriptional regulator n=1 Tax=Gaetbulibacter saemankumensis TaxID=311208 RepID=UPI00041AD6A3|nr:helix-turn-helix domain-containing protein [Gaetbulibacter saemankumensis]
MEHLTFENLPKAIAELKQGQSELKDLILNKDTSQPQPEAPIQLDDVVPLTGKTKTTIYGYVQKNKIPHHKIGNRLYFFKSEIIDWIKTGKRKTLREIESETDEYLSKK